MSVHPISALWRLLIQKASTAVLERQSLASDTYAGRRGEEAAYWYLRRQGFVMVERNYRPEGRHSEIDLIGWDGDVLVFVEVKTRAAAEVQTPDAAVDLAKQRHVIAAAREYRRRANALSKPFRFDIVSIVASQGGPESERKLQHFRDAFREQPQHAP